MTGMKIALTGKMRAGKDTAADYLVNHFGFKRFALGDGIRDLCGQLFPGADAEGKPRTLYQNVGEAMRKIESDVWINHLLRRIDEETRHGDNIVVTDIRQWEEYFSMMDNGFIIGRINASEIQRIRRMKALGDQVNINRIRHKTEKVVDKLFVDFEIENEGSVRELYRQMDQVLINLTKKVA
ncbi:AAA family ATPase [Heliophilum fasciatum]|uniref:Dephospho-CoA kinase n=1 Tax=Heliophilum fasciatum TaxID=35700 RepID=A0A4R2REF6_9FIRM|nr:AAA family ATPase [Heliophilum fasciatum]MCW2279241.1 dephospho-CoA kinase [Heliophilum fasciatum]TCP60629.1 dephospho-CoA kinase [Heliophilum fasciatum]